ncbi:hypothetical protein LEP1GSC008_2367 [Leptospira kirschneri serovar Bulgarica str. Nikolaevo]|uniref:Uncharacterized protein n=1 Tax=Leptospira kirschneri serovar Bulgarica str. Nikolaevo TaxID=1240687 RepID=M6FAT0_9LEPT|nr:hypothetical protein LEP1GSC008_2367 [Leptospira kirschneri serovar Bulgarica str. Nikolaevo]
MRTSIKSKVVHFIKEPGPVVCMANRIRPGFLTTCSVILSFFKINLLD